MSFLDDRLQEQLAMLGEESDSKAKRSAIAKMVLLGSLFVLAVVGFTSFVGKFLQQYHQAHQQVQQVADRLDADVVESGQYNRWVDPLPETDPWHNQLRVKYFQDGDFEIVRVSSAGPDRKLGTDDDIVQERTAGPHRDGAKAKRRHQ